MEREKLKALLERSSESGFTPQSGAQLLESLETFAATVKARAEDVRTEVDKLVDHTSSVEQELQNTFNSFRLLSNSQFIENRVYEEDETAFSTNSGAEQQQRPESYEDDIVPRYREAVTLAWNSHEQVLKSSSFRETKHKRLPYIIGTDEFMRDPFCGFSDSQHAPSASSDVRHYDSEVEKDGASMAAQMVGGGIISENEWSEPDSNSSGEQDNKEPAVSAALDFKAMLEAALRGLPYEVRIEHDESSPSVLDSRNGFRDGDAYQKDEAIGIPIVQEARDEDEREADFKDEVTFKEILGKIVREAGHSSRRSFDGSSTWSDDASDGDGDDDASEAVIVNNNTSSPPKVLERITTSSVSSEEVHQAVETTSDAVEEYRHALSDGVSNSGEKSAGSGPREATTLRPRSLFEGEKSIPASTPVSSSSFCQQGGTTLSSLLFGDEEEDEDEAALFGPTSERGQLTRRLVCPSGLRGMT